MLDSGARACPHKGVVVGTSTPGSWPPENRLDGHPRRSHHLLTVTLSTLTGATVAAAVVWSIVSPGDYTTSHDGCVALTTASSTGAATLHVCGPKARALCQSALGEDDSLAVRTRRECELAGIRPSPSTGR